MHVHSQSNSHIANSLASGFNRRHCCILRAWQNFSTFNFAKVICSVQTTAQLAFCLHFHSARVCVFAWMCMCECACGWVHRNGCWSVATQIFVEMFYRAELCRLWYAFPPASPSFHSPLLSLSLPVT